MQISTNYLATRTSNEGPKQSGSLNELSPTEKKATKGAEDPCSPKEKANDCATSRKKASKLRVLQSKLSK